jgi:hypothetical protein
MPKIPKSASFRSVNAVGVYAVPTKEELRLIFIGLEPYDIELQDSGNSPVIADGAHIQAQIVMKRELAEWLWKYLSEYANPLSNQPTSGESKS